MKDYGGPFSFCIWFFLSKNFYFVLMVWVCKKNRSIEKKTIKKKTPFDWQAGRSPVREITWKPKRNNKRVMKSARSPPGDRVVSPTVKTRMSIGRYNL